MKDSADFDAESLASSIDLSSYNLSTLDLRELKDLFEHATTFGSLIQVPEELGSSLPALKQLSEATSQDLFISEALKRLGPLVQQAELLAAQYAAVVANPPYMGGKGMNGLVKKFAQDHYADAKSDLFACFIERGFTLAKNSGHNAMVTMQSWMFLSSFEVMRERVLREKTIRTMAHLGARAFGSISGEVVQTTATVLKNSPPKGYKPVFFRLLDGGEDEKQAALSSGEKRHDATSQDEFKKIPGSPVAYWVSESVASAFRRFPSVESAATARQGMATGDNERFVRSWHEIASPKMGLGFTSSSDAWKSDARWFPFNKGGGYRRWYGNQEHVICYEKHDYEILKQMGNRCPSEDLYFRPLISWSKVTSGNFSVRAYPAGFIFADAGMSIFSEFPDVLGSMLGALNTNVTEQLAAAISPTLNYEVGIIRQLPFIKGKGEHVGKLIEIATRDWNAYERSWVFQSLPLLTASTEPMPTLESSYTAWITQNRDTIAEMKRLEEENNRLFIDAYGLADELTPEVPIEQITLTVNPAYRYGGKLTEEEQWTRFREDSMKELVSYALGCMMGRYSLDEPGLIYAHNGNIDFDHDRYKSYPADDDGIVPLTDNDWFDDDACNRLVEFVSVAWNNENLEENLTFLANNLSPKRNESSRETLRSYLCDKFYKDHLKTYKKRPIYWLFSSGKQKAFQCLVYLHRYNEGTLARMRTEYVIPLQGLIASRIDQLETDISSATTTTHGKRLEKEKSTLVKQRIELQEFDEKLRHYADQRISIDLDDGVKVNYGKFGDLLAEVKAVHGKKVI